MLSFKSIQSLIRTISWQHYTKEEAKSLYNDGAEAVGRTEGEKMAASYVNFYISNKAIILPQFGVPSDSIACDAIQALFPNRKVVGVGSREILLGGGNIHCITQQVPSPSWVWYFRKHEKYDEWFRGRYVSSVYRITIGYKSSYNRKSWEVLFKGSYKIPMQINELVI